MSKAELVQQFFLHLFSPIIVIPVAVGVIVIWRKFKSDSNLVTAADLGQTGFGGGRLGLWATGIIAAVMAFIDGAIWLTWSADDHGQGFTPPGLPPPDSFPTWQIIGFGATMIVTNLLAFWWAKQILLGGQAAALGTAMGFAEAMYLSAVDQASSQEGVGVVLSLFGFWFGLGILNFDIARYREKRK